MQMAIFVSQLSYNTIINREGLMNIHMPAYKNAMDKGVSTVMISYSSWNGVKMHANQDLVPGYLKNTFKLQGFVISDWEGIDRITTPAGSDYSLGRGFYPCRP